MTREQGGGRISSQILPCVFSIVCAFVMLSCGLLGSRALPTNLDWRGLCGTGVGRDAVIHGSPDDARLTWATDRATGERLELLWPIGYSVTFAPALTVLNEQGRVVAHEGDLLIGSCIDDPADHGAIRVSGDDVGGSS